jgi:hypothetical protein
MREATTLPAGAGASTDPSAAPEPAPTSKTGDAP